MAIVEATLQLGVSEVTFYGWRKEHGGATSGDQLCPSRTPHWFMAPHYLYWCRTWTPGSQSGLH